MSGFKINWTKSALLHLNAKHTTKTSVLLANIPIVQHFKYLGIEIFSSLNQIIKHNYSSVLNKILRDMDRWIDLPMSIRARVSIVKMNAPDQFRKLYGSSSPPSSLPTHPLQHLFIKQNRTKGMVSKLYQFLQVTDLVSLPVERVWRRDCPDLAQDFDWGTMWSSIHEASHNPDHQQIHSPLLNSITWKLFMSHAVICAQWKPRAHLFTCSGTVFLLDNFRAMLHPNYLIW